MMKLKIYSVYDSKVGAYLPPFFLRSEGEAIRSFTHAATSDEHTFAKHPSDYTLFDLGEYDDETGSIDTPASPIRICSASEVKREIAADYLKTVAAAGK